MNRVSTTQQSASLRRWLTALVVTLFAVATPLMSCSSSSPGGDDDEQQVQSAVVGTTSTVNDLTSFNVKTYKNLGITEASYSDGWWHVELSFDMTGAGTGNLVIDFQWEDRTGNVVQIPFTGISKLTAEHKLNATIQGTDTFLDGKTIVTNETGAFIPEVLGIESKGNGFYGPTELSYRAANFRFDLDAGIPTGMLYLTAVDQSLGDWEVEAEFNGTANVPVQATNGSAEFNFVIDLTCACVAG